MSTRSILLGLALLLPMTWVCAEADSVLEKRIARLRMALQIARERNDHALVERVETLRRDLSETDAEARLREVETAVGIDAGGWAMAGQPLFRPTPEMQERKAELNAKLSASMRGGDAAVVRAVTQEMLAVLGAQAGVPDGRRAGVKAEPRTLGGLATVALFMEALKTEGRAVRQLSAGQPLPDQMLRLYADVLSGLALLRPVAQKHAPPAVMAELDKLAHGVASILVTLQQPEGHFPFPDLRGKNIRFGDTITRQIKAGRAVVKEGWVITADPDGGTQYDTGVCGTALLQAAQVWGDMHWKKAGLRAADWALAQECCGNFNYNAFSVSLLAHAFQASGDERYLEGALQKFRVGLAPGQAPNGRWMDAHNARTVYHVIILRALADLEAALPESLEAERAEMAAVTAPALKALLDEFDAMGLTVEALPELQAVAALHPAEARLPMAVRMMTGLIVCKCTDGKRVRLGSSVAQLAAVAQAQN